MRAKQRQHFAHRSRQHLLAGIRRREIRLKRSKIPDGMEGGPHQVLDGFPDGGPVENQKNGQENGHPELSEIPPAAMGLFSPLHFVRSFPSSGEHAALPTAGAFAAGEGDAANRPRTRIVFFKGFPESPPLPLPLPVPLMDERMRLLQALGRLRTYGLKTARQKKGIAVNRPIPFSYWRAQEDSNLRHPDS